MDITGKRFGKLVAVSDVTDDIKPKSNIGSRYWLCKCDCGGSIIRRVSSLMAGCTTQCRLCHAQTMQTALKKIKDLTGQTIGNLTALYRIENSTKYKWKCNLCGSETLEQEGTYIKNGNTKSCGCLKINLLKETAEKRRIDLVGKTFSYLTVMRYLGTTYKENYYYNSYECKCVCGNIKEVRTTYLTTGEVTSCGCKTSYVASKAGGGTGIPYEHISVSDIIRKHTPEYKEWHKSCMKRDNYTCFVSGVRGGNLVVHHLTSLNTIIDQYNITKENYKQHLDKLFDLNNGITLSEEAHLEFHTIFGNGNNDKKQFTTFLENKNIVKTI